MDAQTDLLNLRNRYKILLWEFQEVSKNLKYEAKINSSSL